MRTHLSLSCSLVRSLPSSLRVRDDDRVRCARAPAFALAPPFSLSPSPLPSPSPSPSHSPVVCLVPSLYLLLALFHFCMTFCHAYRCQSGSSQHTCAARPRPLSVANRLRRFRQRAASASGCEMSSGNRFRCAVLPPWRCDRPLLRVMLCRRPARCSTASASPSHCVHAGPYLVRSPAYLCWPQRAIFPFGCQVLRHRCRTYRAARKASP